jgi:hypothetical protein
MPIWMQSKRGLRIDLDHPTTRRNGEKWTERDRAATAAKLWERNVTAGGKSISMAE